MGKLTISIAMFNSYVKLPEGNGYEYGVLNCILWFFSMGILKKWYGPVVVLNCNALGVLCYVDGFAGVFNCILW